MPAPFFLVPDESLAMGKWKRAWYGAKLLFNVGILDDGTLHNPNGYPDDIVRAAVLGAEARRHERRSESAKKAAETRRARRDRKVQQIAERARQGQGIGNRSHCYVCGKSLGDPASIARGIGPECWQDVLSVAEALAAR